MGKLISNVPKFFMRVPVLGGWVGGILGKLIPTVPKVSIRTSSPVWIGGILGRLISP